MSPLDPSNREKNTTLRVPFEFRDGAGEWILSRGHFPYVTPVWTELHDEVRRMTRELAAKIDPPSAIVSCRH